MLIDLKDLFLDVCSRPKIGFPISKKEIQEKYDDEIDKIITRRPYRRDFHDLINNVDKDDYQKLSVQKFLLSDWDINDVLCSDQLYDALDAVVKSFLYNTHCTRESFSRKDLSEIMLELFEEKFLENVSFLFAEAVYADLEKAYYIENPDKIEEISPFDKAYN